MDLTVQRTFTLTLTENEASVIARALDDVCVNQIIVPDEVKKLRNILKIQLMVAFP